MVNKDFICFRNMVIMFDPMCVRKLIVYVLRALNALVSQYIVELQIHYSIPKSLGSQQLILVLPDIHHFSLVLIFFDLFLWTFQKLIVLYYLV